MLNINQIKNKFSQFLILVLTLLLFTLPSNTYAQNNLQTGENIVLKEGEVINKDYFAAGDKVTILGTINGDAYLAGGKIVVDGVINGDLIAGGGEITINGEVTQNVRIAGGNINIDGLIGRNATVLGGNIIFTKDSILTGSLTSAGGNLNLYSPIGKDLYLGAGDVTIGNTVGGDINAGVGSITLNPDASISGGLNYISEQQVQILDGATISGQVKHTLPPADTKSSKETAENAAAGFDTFYKAITFSSLLILGLLLIKFFPNFSRFSAQTISSRFWASLVVGLLTPILIVIAFILLLITVLGIPLALILLLGFMLSLYLSKIFVSILLGNFISEKLNQTWNLYVSFILGLAILTILSFIPLLGLLISLFTNIIGLGALLLSKQSFYLKLKKDL